MVQTAARRHPRSLAHVVSVGLGAVALAGATPGAARAEDVATALSPLGVFGAGGDGIVEWLLPYSPYVFDVVVQLSRSVVAVTYTSRDYDPITRDFVVTGLKAGRGGIDVAVERIRINASMALYEGIEIDTRNIPMEPEARKALADLGSEIVRGDILTAVAADGASATYDIALKADFENLGALAVEAKVEGFHVLVPLDEVADQIEATPPMDGAMPAERAPQSDAPVVVGRLLSARLGYDDAGLTPAGLTLAAEAQNMAPAELRGMMAMMLTPMVTSLFSGLPGGASPELIERSAGWSATLQAYIADPQHLEVTFSPEEPFDLGVLKPGASLDEAMILALNPDVSTEATERTALIDPAQDAVVGADDLSLAERLVEGVGIPQDVARGVALALADVAAGKPEAADIVVRGIVLDPATAVSGDAAPSSYVLLLLAKARGVAVPDAVMTAVRTRLDIAEIADAETAAFGEWRETEDGKAQEAEQQAAIDARDWDALRAIAFDYYEGQLRPRSLARAYTFAQIAAAGGDRIAATLRNDLTAALADGRLAFDAPAAREEASRIWAGIVSAAVQAEGSGEPGAQ